MEIILPDPETGKRYNAQSAYLKKRFGKKTVKISLNGGFTCPNRDGTKGVGGCTYCSAKGGGDFGGDPAESISMQFEDVRGRLEKKWGSDLLYIPYFQANTGTYAPPEYLKSLYEEALVQKMLWDLPFRHVPTVYPPRQPTIWESFPNALILPWSLACRQYTTEQPPA